MTGTPMMLRPLIPHTPLSAATPGSLSAGSALLPPAAQWASAGDFFLGIDLGGTNLKMGAVDPDGQIVLQHKIPVGNARTPDAVMRLITGCLQEIVDELGDRPLAIGMGVPGMVDTSRGVVADAPAFPAWRNEPIQEMLAQATGLPAVVENDANLAALAEQKFGAGTSFDNLIFLTLGTGVGGGIIIGGKVFHGESGMAGEVGHIIVEQGGVLCGCGAQGCLERYAAASSFALHLSRLSSEEQSAFLQRAGVDVDGLLPAVLAELDDAGDPTALKLWTEFGRYLGLGIASMASMIGITTFFVGGGIAPSLHRFQGALMAAAWHHLRESSFERLEVNSALLGNDAGLLGAAAAAQAIVPA